MVDILYITGGIALLALAGFFIYLILFIKESKGLIGSATNTLNNLSTQVETQLQNVDSIVKNVGKLTDDLTVVVDDATHVIHEGKTIVVSLMELEQTLQRSVQEPIIETVSILSALGKGIKAFRLRLADRIELPEQTNGVSHGYRLPVEQQEF